MKNGTRSLRDGPLDGRTVLVTRPVERSAALSGGLREAGASVVELPTIRIVDPPDPGLLVEAARRLDRYEWIVFTSASGVRRMIEALDAAGRPTSALTSPRLAAIGPATGAELEQVGYEADVVPGSYRAEGLIEALVPRRSPDAGARPLEGIRFLLPRAAGARPLLPEALRAAGATVDELTAYVAVTETSSAEMLRRLIAGRELDWITFTSSSTVRSFVELAGPETGGARVAAIGPITATTAGELGLTVDVVADRYTSDGLVRAVANAS